MYTRRIINCLGESCLNTSNTHSNSVANITTRTNGNIGIGTSNPSYLLDVNGEIKSTSLITQSLSTTNISSQNMNINSIVSTNVSCSNINTSSFIATNSSIVNTTFTNLVTTNSSINSINTDLGFFVNNTTTNLVILSSTQSSINNISVTNSTTSTLTSSNMKVDGTMSSVSFNGVGAFPIGTIMIWASNTIPTEYVRCDGSSYNRTGTYSSLFNVIGTSFGSVSASTFNVPNLSGRVPVGRGTSGNTSSLGQTGGSETITLGISEMPSHSHSGSTGINGGTHDHTYSQTVADQGTRDGVSITTFFGSVNFGNTSRNTTVAGDHRHNIQSAGGGQAHNNIQPYIVFNYIIKFQ